MRWNISLAWFSVGVLTSGAVTYLATAQASQGPGLSFARARATITAAAGEDAPGFDQERVGGSADRAVAPGLAPDTVEGNPTKRQVSELRDGLFALRESNSREPSEYRSLFGQLLALGEPGMVATLELMGEPAFDIPIRGRVFMDAYKGVEDERIFPAVVALLAEYRRAGWTRSSFRDGYYEMIAQHGGRDGAEYLLDRIREDPRDDMARRALGEVRDHEVMDMVLADLGTGQGFSEPDLAKVLATWNDPRVNERLIEMASDDDVPASFRRSALSGVLAQTTDPAVAEKLIGNVRSAGSSTDRAIALRGVYGLGENRHLDAGLKRELVIPLLVDALRDTEHSVRGAAMSSINDFRIYHTAEIEAALVELLNLGWEEREKIELLLGKVRNNRH